MSIDYDVEVMKIFRDVLESSGIVDADDIARNLAEIAYDLYVDDEY